MYVYPGSCRQVFYKCLYLGSGPPLNLSLLSYRVVCYKDIQAPPENKYLFLITKNIMKNKQEKRNANYFLYSKQFDLFPSRWFSIYNHLIIHCMHIYLHETFDMLVILLEDNEYSSGFILCCKAAAHCSSLDKRTHPLQLTG